MPTEERDRNENVPGSWREPVVQAQLRDTPVVGRVVRYERQVVDPYRGESSFGDFSSSILFSLPVNLI